jgi:hypothetical protein
MARTSKQKPVSAPPPPPPAQLTDRVADIYLATLSIAVLLSFFPLLRYFFAQDDFVLMHVAARDGWNAVTDYFSQKPGHFRPLTKAAYFGVMHRLFGLNPGPFHAASIALHLVNNVLFFFLMRRVRISTAAALLATSLFALSVAFFHVIAWISCIQQLMGQCFMLASLVWGIDYLRDRRRRSQILSVVAYTLALLSVEQTFAVPAILVLYALLSPGGGANLRSPRAILDRLSIHLVVMAVYIVFLGVWKTAPREGDYAFSFGLNVLVNLATYLGWTLNIAAALPSRMATGTVVWGFPHVALALLVAYNLVRKRWREVLFGFLFFLAAILPTLFLTNHTFYLHTYIPAFGIIYMIALAAEDVFALRRLRVDRTRLAVLGCVLLAMTAVSFVMVRKNEKYKMFGFLELQRSFVLRRATIAKKIYDGVTAAGPAGDNVQKVYMVYGREEGRDTAAWNRKNVVAASGQGSLINLIYEKPLLPVLFKVAGDKIDWEEQYVSDIFFFDDFGNSRPMEEQTRD